MRVGSGAGGSGVKADSIAAIRLSLSESFFSGTGTIPHRPRTQRPNPEDLREPGVVVEFEPELSAETTDAVSEEFVLPALAAMEASRERDDFSGPFARSAVTVGADMTGDVDTSATLGDMRR